MSAEHLEWEIEETKHGFSASNPKLQIVFYAANLERLKTQVGKLTNSKVIIDSKLKLAINALCTRLDCNDST